MLCQAHIDLTKIRLSASFLTIEMADIEQQTTKQWESSTPANDLGLQWSDIRYAVSSKSLKSAFWRSRSKPTAVDSDQGKLLLTDLSGHVRPGEMLAIMGPSGAGKSTLLDILSGRKLPSSGSVTLTGHGSDIKANSSYVEQHDALLGVLTVRETIWYSAKLSLPATTTKKEIDDRTDAIVAGLGLSGVANQRIGTPIQRGISGGQKRRVTIGCSLVTLPKVLFLDEPTSGLDTATAFEVIKAIKNLAKQHGITVLATIHSPNWEIFSSFDSTLLLSKGVTVYQGSVHNVASHFAALGYPCPQFSNPADHMISLVNDDFASEVAAKDTASSGHTASLSSSKSGGQAAALRQAWSARIIPPARPIPASAQRDALAQVSHTKRNQRGGVATSWSQTMTLTRRNFVNYSRNLLAYGVRVGMYIGMGVLLATVWVNLAETDSRINDRLSVHFFSVAFLGFMAVAGIPAFLEERGVMKRESSNNLYGALPFTLANTIVTVPLLFFCSLLFSVICYWSIGLHPGAGSFLRFLAFLYLGVLAAEFQALLVAAMIPIFVAALAVAAFLNGFWMCVQGYFIRAVNLPRFWYYWAHFIDYETYAFDILVKNDFQGIVFACTGSITEGSCKCSYPSSLIDQGICAIKGEDVLQSLDLNGIDVTTYAFILLAIIVIYRLLFYAVLRFQM